MFVLYKLFYIFFKIGLCSFGGGYVILSAIYQEIGSLHSMTAHEFSDIVAISNMTPGPIAINAATYVGFKTGGFWGAIVATIAVIVPSFIIVLIVSAFFSKFKNSRIVQALLSGIRPATVGMIGSAVYLFANTSIINMNYWGKSMLLHPFKFLSIPALAIFVLTIICTKKFKIGPITLTLAAGVLGAIIL